MLAPAPAPAKLVIPAQPQTPIGHQARNPFQNAPLTAPPGSLIQTPVKQQVLNADFKSLPRNPTLRDKLGLSSSQNSYKAYTARSSTTPKDISVTSVIQILNEGLVGLNRLASHIPGLERVSRVLADVNDTLNARKGDTERFLDTPIDNATAPPTTPAVNSNLSDASSPAIQHPFARPASNEVITLKHWIYDLQKNSWIFNEKTLRYENTPTSILNQGSRKRKLQDLGMELHSSWVNLMLHLGLVIAQQNSESQMTTSTNLNNLVVATGLAEVVSEMGNDNIKSLFIQGEKYLLGYGVPQSFDIAFRRYESAAKHHLPEAANMLGVMYEFGMGVKKDLANAVKYYMIAANQNNPDALNHLGRLHETGKGCEISLKTAAALYKKAANSGHTDGLSNYAYALQNGLGIPENKKLAVEYYQMAADKGYAKAQNALGTCYYQGLGVKRDFFQATLYYRKGADQGYAPAQNNLGICYEEGQGIPQDMPRAKAYYKLSSDKKHAGATNNLAYVLLLGEEYLEAIEKFYLAKCLGSVDAIFHLGHLYEVGCNDKKGVVLQPDIDMAMRFYKEAGDKGHTKSLLRLSSIHICGPERIVNLSKAVAALKKVADVSLPTLKGIRSEDSIQRDASDAQNMLGELCELGLHTGAAETTPDTIQALVWYRKALKNGHERAMFNIAAIYDRGEVIPRDMEKAVRLYTEAGKRGNVDAQERLLELENLAIQ